MFKMGGLFKMGGVMIDCMKLGGVVCLIWVGL